MLLSGRVASRRVPGIIATLAFMMTACTSTAPGGTDAPGSDDDRKAVQTTPVCDQLDVLVRRVARGYVARRGADIVPIPAEPTFIGGPIKPVHTGPWDHLARVPLIAYGPGIVPATGAVRRPATMADVAPTVARMIGYDFRTPDGNVLDEAIDTDARRPRVVVVIVWDGGGWNVLRHHADSWPYLERLSRRGVSFTRFEIGSSPSNTPPIHTTLGTGVFPFRHGIPNVRMRAPDGEDVDPFLGAVADNVEVPTLADLYDRDRGNRPQAGVVATVNWHLGMLGHGASFPRGDADVAVLLNSAGQLFGTPGVYELSPSPDPDVLSGAVERLDARDGERDARWGKEDLEDVEIRAASPAWIDFQQDLLEDTIATHGFGRDDVPDLLFTNFKMVDDAGHRWGPFSSQVAQAVEASDDALQRLTRFLDRTVGRRQWVVMVTADHGQEPYPRDTGIWPIANGPLGSDLHRRFDDNANGRSVLERVSASGLYIDRDEARTLGVSLEDIARWLIDYRARDNKKPGEPLPAVWRDDPGRPLFAGVVVGDRLVADRCDR